MAPLPRPRSRSVINDLIKSGTLPPAKPTVAWEPKYPEFSSVGPDGADVPVGFEDVKLIALAPWTEAPSTSHLIGFRAWIVPKRSILSGGRYKGYLFVRFKGNTTKTKTYPDREYEYLFEDKAECERAFKLLADAEHPGQVVQTELIDKRVPYRLVAVGDGNDAKNVGNG